MRYFVAHPKDGTVADFNKECHTIGFFGEYDNAFIFKKRSHNETLGIIPVENVNYIVRVEEYK